MNTQSNFSKDEEVIKEALLDARKVQEYLWQELSLSNSDTFNLIHWSNVFDKRVEKIKEINPFSPAYKVELRKRILQQCALSICAIKLLDNLK